MKRITLLALAAGSVFLAGCLSGSGRSMSVEDLPAGSLPGLISPREAVGKALAHAGLERSDATLKTCEKDVEWGTVVYEIEFTHGFFEYEYDVDARTGKILTFEKSWDW